MTLHTRVLLMGEGHNFEIQNVFKTMAAFIGADEDFDYKYTDDRKYAEETYTAAPGQGLPALLWVDRRKGGAIEIHFDTAYGYKGENGAGCTDVHAYLIYEIVRWYADKGTVMWYDEFNGIWHDVGSKAEFLEELTSVYPPDKDDSSDFRNFGDYKVGKISKWTFDELRNHIKPPDEAPRHYKYIRDPFGDSKKLNPEYVE